MSFRQTAKLVGGSAVVYAVAAGVPTSTPGDATCNGNASTASVFGPEALAADDDTQQSGARLKATYLEADDGSRQFLGWRDTLREVDCSFAVAADGTWRCLPSGADAGRFFADASCTQRLATVPRGCTQPPAFAILRDVPACVWQQSRQVFSLGPPHAAPLAYWSAGGACVPASTADLVLYDLYVVGDEVTPSSFVSATPQAEP
jgi:hypothetical protein